MSTRTFAKLPVSKAVYDEIAKKLITAGYQDMIKSDMIDMNGIGLVAEPGPVKKVARRISRGK